MERFFRFSAALIEALLLVLMLVAVVPVMVAGVLWAAGRHAFDEAKAKK